MPCCQRKSRSAEALEVRLSTLVITEIIRWVVMVVPLYLCIWQYTKYRGYTIFISSADEKVQFWALASAVIAGMSLFVYLPMKVAGMRFRISRNMIKDHRWRPSIVAYIVFCALPCLTIVLVAVKNPTMENKVDTTESPCSPGVTLEAEAAAVLQIAVFGLTITEWMSKLREEVITYDLITAMTIDFFFAYDVIAFIITDKEPEIFNSAWVYVCFVFAWVAMFKYVPTQPVSVGESGAPKGAAACIVVELLCCDIPFAVVRLSTRVLFGYKASDFIHTIKNIGMVVFGAIQLGIIYRNTQDAKEHKAAHFKEKRMSKHPGAWGDVISKVMSGEGRVTPTRDSDTAGEHSNNAYSGETPSDIQLDDGGGHVHGDVQVSDLD